MSSARAPLVRRYKITQRPEAPNILPPRWSRRRIVTTAISSTAVLVTAVAIGPAYALLNLNLAGPTQIATPATTINAPIGDVLRNVVRAPLPLLDPLLGRDPAAPPAPVDDPVAEPAPASDPQPDARPAKDDDEAKPAKQVDPVPARKVDQRVPAPVVAPTPVDPPKPIVKPAPDLLTPVERQLFNFVNAERTRAGLPKLELDMGLVEKARLHSEQMSAAKRPFHTVNLASLAPGKWRVIGENVGVGKMADGLHARFMQSSTHKSNILGHYDRFGVGVVSSGGRLWVTEHFLSTD
jgi:uncharacterized protein YkwD